jgi:hypothetical protein
MELLTEDEFLDFLNEMGLSDKGQKITNTEPHIIIFKDLESIVCWIELHEDGIKYKKV